MDCWICNAPGESGEHKIKKTDLKVFFGEVSQNKPLYWYSKKDGVQKVQGLKSEILKFDDLICKDCNNNLSQRYDRSWEKISKYILNNMLLVSGAGVIYLNKSFPKANINNLMLGTHLFFLKIFGCLIKQGKIPINLDPFAKSLLTRKAHKDIYIIIGRIKEDGEIRSVGITDVHAEKLDEEVVFAHWNYMIGELVVRVIFDPLKRKRKLLRKSWHPRNHGYKLRIHRGYA